MGKSSNSGGTQTVVNKTELPQWVQDAAQKNLNAAYQVAGNLMGPYTGPRVAGMTPNQLSNINAIQGNVGSTNPAFALAQGTAADMTGFQPGQVNAGSLAGTDLSSYMNPFTQNVIQSGLNAIDMQRQQALNQIGDQAIKTGAFGGSRQGVQEGITNAASALQAGNLASQLMAQNFGQAQNAATNDINRNLQAQLANQQAGLQGAGVNLAGANALGNLADAGQNAFLRGTAAALSGQEAIQNQNQQQLSAAQQLYNEQQQFPIQQLQIPLQALGMTPYGQSSTQNTTLPPANPFLTGLGGLGIGAQIGGMIPGLGAGTGAIGGGLLGVLGALSDRTEKTDIKHVGKDPDSGLDLYAYRYKGDPKSYPKVVGPMAQDIEKKFPGSTSKIGGKLVINGSLGFGAAA